MNVSAKVDAPIVRLVRLRWRVSIALSLAMMLIYFSFMGLIAFHKAALATILAPGVSVALIAGPSIIVSAFLLCAAYVVWTNKVYDPAVRALKK
ncbi:DUF485 domain-containing protein [Roseixanthobacter glucoisosaccharinicivorans]|uniref:DUF485 domain-containing protein n=1 Tax=Roseixanthobacter glucoisosaccharinicivorans TaxID=3119923 RepID=UPI0037287501